MLALIICHSLSSIFQTQPHGLQYMYCVAGYIYLPLRDDII